MKRLETRSLVAGAAVATALAVSAYAIAAERQLARFNIVVAIHAQENQVVLKCVEGCAWTDLSFSCRAGEECSSPVNERGMAASR